MNSKKDKVKNPRYFQEGWLNDPVFKDRLRKDSKDKAKARTAVYHKTFELSSSGRSAITWKRKETSSKLEEDKQFLLASKKKKDESNSASQISALETPKMSSATAGQQTLDSCINISECCESRSYLDNED